MSLLSKPLWVDLGGSPTFGAAPVSVVIRSGSMTARRHGEIQQIYQRFCMAKLTAVGTYFVFNRVLTDGTRVRFESNQGTDRIFVWAYEAAPEIEEKWEYGWTFTPANNTSLGGFTRKPGADANDFSAGAFVAAGNGSNKGKAVHTFVNSKNGNRALCTTREGGSRVWRAKGADKNPGLLLTYEGDAVFVKGKKTELSLMGSTGFVTKITGAAIARSAKEDWLVFVLNAKVCAIKLRDLKDKNTAYVECGSAWSADKPAHSELSLWEFAPDGLHAISIAGSSLQDGVRPLLIGTVLRFTLTPKDGEVPFSVSASYEVVDAEPGLKKRVINTFHFNEASRNFHFEGWRDFGVEGTRSYYGAITHNIDGGWGPTFTIPGNPIPDRTNPITGHLEQWKILGNQFVPTMGIRDLNRSGSQVVEHVNPIHFTNDELEVSIPQSDFLFVDEGAPQEILYVRNFSPAPKNQKPTGINQVGLYFEHLNGWLIQYYEVKNFFFATERSDYEPYLDANNPRHIKNKERLAITTVEQQSTDRFNLFETLDALAQYCELIWGATHNSVSSVSLSSMIQSFYRSLVNKSNYSDYIAFHEHIASTSNNLTDREKSTNLYTDKKVVIDFQGGTTRIFDLGEEPGIEDAEYGVTEKEYFPIVGADGETTMQLKTVSQTTSLYPQEKTSAYKLNAFIYGSPVYKNNWTTDWILESSIHLSGKAIFAAGFDKDGKEVLAYFEGDETKRLQYVSSAKGADVEKVSLRWEFSGSMGYALKINSATVDVCEYSVSDSVELQDGEFVDDKAYIGSSPEIRAQAISIHDFDVYLGQVLYRKTLEVFRSNGITSDNKAVNYTLTIKDYLRTPSANYQLGAPPSITSADRPVNDEFAYFANTKNMFYLTAPFFEKPSSINLHGEVFKFASNGQVANISNFKNIVPPSQRDKVGSKSGVVEKQFDPLWLTYMMLYYPGEDYEPCQVIGGLLSDEKYAEYALKGVGKFLVSPKSSFKLRAFSDHCWMVCYQHEQHFDGASSAITTAKYYLKLNSKTAAKEFRASDYFGFLGVSKKLLHPKFHIKEKE